MSTRSLIALVALCALFVLPQVSAGQEKTYDVVRGALEKYVRQAQPAEPQVAPDKAVPRTDKAEATVIGTTILIGATDFLSDGTPFRIIALRAQRPVVQEVFIACLGSFNNSCGRLGIGRRVQFTADILVVDEGESAGLALIIAKRIKT